MIVARRHRRLSWSQRLFALAAALWVVVQVSGVQQLCFCGSCAVSRVLAQWLPEALAPRPASTEAAAADVHPCCAEARRQAERELAERDHWSSADGDCGCGEGGHTWQAWTTAADASVSWTVGSAAPLAAQHALEPWQPRLPLATAQALFSCGPPRSATEPLFLRQRRLLI